MLFHFLFALCLSLLSVSPSRASYGSVQPFDYSSFTYLPINGLPAYRVYDWDIPAVTNDAWIIILSLGVNQTFDANVAMCPGCYLVVAGCELMDGPESPECLDNFHTDFFEPKHIEGWYYYWFHVPKGQNLFFTLVHETHVNGTTIPNVFFYRIHNPDPNPPSSTGPAVDWPLGYPTGLFVSDGVSSAFLPRNDGWSWIEYDRDLSNYTFNVDFETHLMTMDAFWIDPTFGDATYVSTGLNHTITPGTWFGSWENPITDEFTNFDYHFTIPLGGFIDITLHYIYQMPGETYINNQTVHVTIGNFFGMDPDTTISQLRSIHKQGFNVPFDILLPQPELPDSSSTAPALSVPPTQDNPVIEEVPSAVIPVNDASSLVMSAWPVIVCVFAAIASF